MSGFRPGGPVDRRRFVTEYVRLERWEPDGDVSAPPALLLGRVPVDPHVVGGGGGLRLGALLTCLDSLGGFMSGLHVLPAWIVTTTLTAAMPVPAHVGPLRLEARVLRRGRTSVVTALGAVDEGAADRPVATATMTCAVLDPGQMERDVTRPVRIPLPPPAVDPPSLTDFFGIEPEDGPETRLHLADHVRNPWGILHGGGLAVLADEAACRAAVRDAPPGGPAPAAVGAVLHYLRPSRTGPLVARGTVLGRRDGRSVVRVDVVDTGEGDRQVLLATVTVAGG